MKVTAVLLIALTALALLRNRSAALRHWVLATCVICAAMIPVLERTLPRWSLTLGAQVISSSRFDLAARPATNGSGAAIQEQVVVSPPSRSHEIAKTRPTASQIFEFAWLAGTLLSVLILAIGLCRLSWLAARARRMTTGPWRELADQVAVECGIRRPFALLHSAHPSLLVTWGLAFPKIILPAAATDWSADRARIVLRHELAHIQRGDWTVQMLAELLRSVYWFNPLLWVVCRRLRLESERACDDEVMNHGVGPSEYAGHLLDLAKALNVQRHNWYPAPAMARPSSLERRVRAMLNDRINRVPLTARTRIIVFLMAFVIATGVAAAQSMFHTLSGTVVDSMNLPVSGATLVLDNPERRSKYQVTTSETGAFEFVGLQSGEYALEVRAMGFKVLRSPVILKGADVQRRLALEIGELQETIVITATVDDRQTSTTPRIKEGAPWAPPDLTRCAQSPIGGRIVPPKKIRDAYPSYPLQLQGSDVQGTVNLTARIGLDGFPTDIQVVGDAQPDLAYAAIAAVREWRYTSTLLNCTPVEPTFTIAVNFKLVPPASKP